MEFGLIGEKLGHSFSKDVHAELGNYPYELKEIKKEDLSLFLDSKAFRGINVTIPYKQEVLSHLDFHGEEVKAIGACNTVVNDQGKLKGFNTDAYGLEALIQHAKIDVKGRKCAILGTGGTSKTAAYVLSKLGAGSIIKVSRTKKEGACDYACIPLDIEILINTTPCGMYPDSDDTPLDLSSFSKLIAVFDAIYNPLRTTLLLQAKKRGIVAEGGLYMLVAQAVKASELFLDKQYEEGTLDRIYTKLLIRKENIVLIGMPTSGKTSVGKALSLALDRPFLDVDERIEKRIGMDIPSFFAKNGEAAFRDLEEEVIAEISKKTGQVIATGGGSILRKQNVDRLKQNGHLYFLDRPLSCLIAAKNRPLSSDPSALKKRYEERHDLYLAAADSVIEGSLNSAETTALIKGERQ